MNIIFGFGQTEEQQREKTFNDIANIIKKIIKKYKNPNGFFFTEEMFKEFKEKFEKYTEQNKDEYNNFEKKPKSKRPNRYYHISYGQRITYDLDCIFVAIKFWHINCNHPFSPDGIALLSIKDCRAFYYKDLLSKF